MNTVQGPSGSILTWSSIPFLTAIAYAVAFCWQHGKAFYFSVPGEFISITLTSGFDGALGVLFYLVLPLPIYNFLLVPIDEIFRINLHKRAFGRITILLILYVTISVLIIYAVGWSILVAIGLASIPLAIALTVIALYAVELLVRWIRGKPQGERKSFGDGLKATVDDWANENDVMRVFSNVIGQHNFSKVLALLLLLILSFLAGYRHSRVRTTFFQLPDRPFVLVGNFGETLVFRKYDATANRFHCRFISIPASHYDQLVFESVQIKNASFEKPSAESPVAE